MAGKKKASKAKSAASSTSNVTRVRATESAPVKKVTKPKASVTKVKATSKSAAKAAPTEVKAKAVKAAPVEAPAKRRRSIKPGIALKPVKATGSYFAGAWNELKQVRWPTRRATWSLTGAVLLYTLFFTVLVLVLDAIFKYTFELILGK